MANLYLSTRLLKRTIKTSTVACLNLKESTRFQEDALIRRNHSSSSRDPETTSLVSVNKYIITESSFKSPDTWIKKVKHLIGFGEANKIALRRATIFHYQACTDKLDFEDCFDKFKLPDTVFSFFLIIQLHVWMCQVRSMSEGPEGRLLRNEIMERMWQDIDARLQRLEYYVYKQRKTVMEDLLFHFQAAMLSYDEGLLVDDKTLASALWRTLYSKGSVDAETLEFAVRYVRTQMQHLRSIGPREWCINGRFDWVPFPSLKEK